MHIAIHGFAIDKLPVFIEKIFYSIPDRKIKQLMASLKANMGCARFSYIFSVKTDFKVYLALSQITVLQKYYGMRHFYLICRYRLSLFLKFYMIFYTP